MTLDSASNFGNLSVGESDPMYASLEQRVQRLEEAVAVLQETRPAEVHQVKAGPAPIEDVPPPPDPPVTAMAPPPAPWLLVDIIAEARAMVRMFFDIHYRMAWYTRIAVLIILVLILLSDIWVGWVPFIGFLLAKVWDLTLAFLAYKVLSREARRYREWRGLP